MQKRWKYFLKTIKDDSFGFSVVIEEIQKFLEPVFDAIVRDGVFWGIAAAAAWFVIYLVNMHFPILKGAKR